MKTLRPFQVGAERTVAGWRDELDEAREVLVGRAPPPATNGILTLMEVAAAYLARAQEIEQIIYRAEADERVKRGDPAYKFRTGELRSFIEMAKKSVDLGSRRVTAARLEFDLQAEASNLGGP